MVEFFVNIDYGVFYLPVTILLVGGLLMLFVVHRMSRVKLIPAESHSTEKDEGVNNVHTE